MLHSVHQLVANFAYVQFGAGQVVHCGFLKLFVENCYLMLSNIVRENKIRKVAGCKKNNSDLKV